MWACSLGELDDGSPIVDTEELRAQDDPKISILNEFSLVWGVRGRIKSGTFQVQALRSLRFLEWSDVETSLKVVDRDTAALGINVDYAPCDCTVKAFPTDSACQTSFGRVWLTRLRNEFSKSSGQEQPTASVSQTKRIELEGSNREPLA